MDEGNYLFVSGLQKTYSGTVRAHVLRQHILKRKGRLSTGTRECQQVCAQNKGFRGGKLPTNPATESKTQRDEETPQHLSFQDEILEAVDPPLIRSMSAARTDPFQIFARHSSPREDFLLDYYVGDLLEHFGTPGAAPFNPCRDACFPTCITGEASFNAMCSFAARHLAQRTGASQSEALYYRVATFRCINEAIENPNTRFADSTILAIIGTIAFEQEGRFTCFDVDHKSDTELQLQGLRRILIARGGFLAVVDSPAISWITHWYDLINHGKLSAGTTPFSVHACSAPSPLDVKAYGNQDLNGLTVDAKEFGVEEFLVIYSNFYRNASERNIRSRISTERGLPLADTAICRLFGRGSLIWKLLTEPDILYGRNRKIIALVYIHLSLWQYRDSLDVLWDRFCGRLCTEMVMYRFDLASPISVLIWIMVTNTQTGQLEDYERVWTTARFLYVYDKLSEGLQVRLDNALMLAMAPEAESDFEDVLTPELLREEFMKELGLTA